MVEMEHEECGQGAVKLPSEDEPICNFGSVQAATSADSENKEEIGKDAESVPEADAGQQDASSEHNEATSEEVKDSAIKADRTEESDIFEDRLEQK